MKSISGMKPLKVWQVIVAIFSILIAMTGVTALVLYLTGQFKEKHIKPEDFTISTEVEGEGGYVENDETGCPVYYASDDIKLVINSSTEDVTETTVTLSLGVNESIYDSTHITDGVIIIPKEVRLNAQFSVQLCKTIDGVNSYVLGGSSVITASVDNILLKSESLKVVVDVPVYTLDIEIPTSNGEVMKLDKDNTLTVTKGAVFAPRAVFNSNMEVGTSYMIENDKSANDCVYYALTSSGSVSEYGVTHNQFYASSVSPNGTAEATITAYTFSTAYNQKKYFEGFSRTPSNDEIVKYLKNEIGSGIAISKTFTVKVEDVSIDSFNATVTTKELYVDTSFTIGVSSTNVNHNLGVQLLDQNGMAINVLNTFLQDNIGNFALKVPKGFKAVNVKEDSTIEIREITTSGDSTTETCVLEFLKSDKNNENIIEINGEQYIIPTNINENNYCDSYWKMKICSNSATPVNFEVSFLLAQNSGYLVFVQYGEKDLSGNKIAKTYTFNFNLSEKSDESILLFGGDSENIPSETIKIEYETITSGEGEEQVKIVQRKTASYDFNKKIATLTKYDYATNTGRIYTQVKYFACGAYDTDGDELDFTKYFSEIAKYPENYSVGNSTTTLYEIENGVLPVVSQAENQLVGKIKILAVIVKSFDTDVYETDGKYTFVSGTESFFELNIKNSVTVQYMTPTLSVNEAYKLDDSDEENKCYYIPSHSYNKDGVEISALKVSISLGETNSSDESVKPILEAIEKGYLSIDCVDGSGNAYENNYVKVIKDTCKINKENSSDWAIEFELSIDADALSGESDEEKQVKLRLVCQTIDGTVTESKLVDETASKTLVLYNQKPTTMSSSVDGAVQNGETVVVFIKSTGTTITIRTPDTSSGSEEGKYTERTLSADEGSDSTLSQLEKMIVSLNNYMQYKLFDQHENEINQTATDGYQIRWSENNTADKKYITLSNNASKIDGFAAGTTSLTTYIFNNKTEKNVDFNGNITVEFSITSEGLTRYCLIDDLTNKNSTYGTTDKGENTKVWTATSGAEFDVTIDKVDSGKKLYIGKALKVWTTDSEKKPADSSSYTIKFDTEKLGDLGTNEDLLKVITLIRFDENENEINSTGESIKTIKDFGDDNKIDIIQLNTYLNEELVLPFVLRENGGLYEIKFTVTIETTKTMNVNIASANDCWKDYIEADVKEAGSINILGNMTYSVGNFASVDNEEASAIVVSESPGLVTVGKGDDGKMEMRLVDVYEPQTATIVVYYAKESSFALHKKVQLTIQPNYILVKSGNDIDVSKDLDLPLKDLDLPLSDVFNVYRISDYATKLDNADELNVTFTGNSSNILVVNEDKKLDYQTGGDTKSITFKLGEDTAYTQKFTMSVDRNNITGFAIKNGNEITKVGDTKNTSATVDVVFPKDKIKTEWQNVFTGDTTPKIVGLQLWFSAGGSYGYDKNANISVCDEKSFELNYGLQIKTPTKFLMSNSDNGCVNGLQYTITKESVNIILYADTVVSRIGTDLVKYEQDLSGHNILQVAQDVNYLKQNAIAQELKAGSTYTIVGSNAEQGFAFDKGTTFKYSITISECLKDNLLTISEDKLTIANYSGEDTYAILKCEISYNDTSKTDVFIMYYRIKITANCANGEVNYPYEESVEALDDGRYYDSTKNAFVIDLSEELNLENSIYGKSSRFVDPVIEGKELTHMYEYKVDSGSASISFEKDIITITADKNSAFTITLTRKFMLDGNYVAGTDLTYKLSNQKTTYSVEIDDGYIANNSTIDIRGGAGGLKYKVVAQEVSGPTGSSAQTQGRLTGLSNTELLKFLKYDGRVTVPEGTVGYLKDSSEEYIFSSERTVSDCDYVYTKTTDADVVSGKTYYTESDGVYTAVTNPSKDNIGGYYEKNISWQTSFKDKDITTYIKTTDTDIISGKTYYTESDGVYTAVTNPSKDNIKSYYEKYVLYTFYNSSTDKSEVYVKFDDLYLGFLHQDGENYYICPQDNIDTDKMVDIRFYTNKQVVSALKAHLTSYVTYTQTVTEIESMQTIEFTGQEVKGDSNYIAKLGDILIIEHMEKDDKVTLTLDEESEKLFGKLITIDDSNNYITIAPLPSQSDIKINVKIKNGGVVKYSFSIELTVKAHLYSNITMESKEERYGQVPFDLTISDSDANISDSGEDKVTLSLDKFDGLKFRFVQYVEVGKVLPTFKNADGDTTQYYYLTKAGEYVAIDITNGHTFNASTDELAIYKLVYKKDDAQTASIVYSFKNSSEDTTQYYYKTTAGEYVAIDITNGHTFNIADEELAIYTKNGEEYVKAEDKALTIFFKNADGDTIQYYHKTTEGVYSAIDKTTGYSFNASTDELAIYYGEYVKESKTVEYSFKNADNDTTQYYYKTKAGVYNKIDMKTGYTFNLGADELVIYEKQDLKSVEITPENVGEAKNTSVDYLIWVYYNDEQISQFTLTYKYRIIKNVVLTTNYPKPDGKNCSVDQAGAVAEFVTNGYETDNFFNGTALFASGNRLVVSKVDALKNIEVKYNYQITVMELTNLKLTDISGTKNYAVGNELCSGTGNIAPVGLKFTIVDTTASGSVKFLIKVNNVPTEYYVVVNYEDVLTAQKNVANYDATKGETIYAEDLVDCEDYMIFAKDRILKYQYKSGVSATYYVKLVSSADAKTKVVKLNANTGSTQYIDLGKSYSGYTYAGTYSDVDCASKADDSTIYTTIPQLTSRIEIIYKDGKNTVINLATYGENVSLVYKTDKKDTEYSDLSTFAINKNMFQTTTTLYISIKQGEKYIATNQQYTIYLDCEIGYNDSQFIDSVDKIGTKINLKANQGTGYSLLEQLKGDIYNKRKGNNYSSSITPTATETSFANSNGQFKVRVYGYDEDKTDLYNAIDAKLKSGELKNSDGHNIIYTNGLEPRSNANSTDQTTNYLYVMESLTTDKSKLVDVKLFANGARNDGKCVLLKLSYTVTFGSITVESTRDLLVFIEANTTVKLASGSSSSPTNTNIQTKYNGEEKYTYLTNVDNPYIISGDKEDSFKLYNLSGDASDTNKVISVDLFGGTNNESSTWFNYTVEKDREATFTQNYVEHVANTNTVTTKIVNLGERTYFVKATEKTYGYYFEFYFTIRPTNNPQINNVVVKDSKFQEGDSISVALGYNMVSPATTSETTNNNTYAFSQTSFKVALAYNEDKTKTIANGATFKNDDGDTTQYYYKTTADGVCHEINKTSGHTFNASTDELAIYTKATTYMDEVEISCTNDSKVKKTVVLSTTVNAVTYTKTITEDNGNIGTISLRTDWKYVDSSNRSTTCDLTKYEDFESLLKDATITIKLEVKSNVENPTEAIGNYTITYNGEKLAQTYNTDTSTKYAEGEKHTIQVNGISANAFDNKLGAVNSLILADNANPKRMSAENQISVQGITLLYNGTKIGSCTNTAITEGGAYVKVSTVEKGTTYTNSSNETYYYRDDSGNFNAIASGEKHEFTGTAKYLNVYKFDTSLKGVNLFTSSGVSFYTTYTENGEPKKVMQTGIDYDAGTMNFTIPTIDSAYFGTGTTLSGVQIQVDLYMASDEESVTITYSDTLTLSRLVTPSTGIKTSVYDGDNVTTTNEGDVNKILNDTLEVTVAPNSSVAFTLTTGSRISDKRELSNTSAYARKFYISISEMLKCGDFVSDAVIQNITLNDNVTIDVVSGKENATFRYNGKNYGLSNTSSVTFTIEKYNPITMNVENNKEFSSGKVSKNLYLLYSDKENSFDRDKVYRTIETVTISGICSGLTAGTTLTDGTPNVTIDSFNTASDGNSTYYSATLSQWGGLINSTYLGSSSTTLSAIGCSKLKFVIDGTGGAVVDEYGTITTTKTFNIKDNIINIDVYCRVSGLNGAFEESCGYYKLGSARLHFNENSVSDGDKLTNESGVYADQGNSVTVVPNGYKMSGSLGDKLTEPTTTGYYAIQLTDGKATVDIATVFGDTSGHTFNSDTNVYYRVVKVDDTYIENGGDSYTFESSGIYTLYVYASADYVGNILCKTIIVYDKSNVVEKSIMCEQSETASVDSLKLEDYENVQWTKTTSSNGQEVEKAKDIVTKAGIYTLEYVTTSAKYYKYNIYIYDETETVDIALTQGTSFTLENLLPASRTNVTFVKDGTFVVMSVENTINEGIAGTSTITARYFVKYTAIYDVNFNTTRDYYQYFTVNYHIVSSTKPTEYRVRVAKNTTYLDAVKEKIVNATKVYVIDDKLKMTDKTEADKTENMLTASAPNVKILVENGTGFSVYVFSFDVFDGEKTAVTVCNVNPTEYFTLSTGNEAVLKAVLGSAYDTTTNKSYSVLYYDENGEVCASINLSSLENNITKEYYIAVTVTTPATETTELTSKTTYYYVTITYTKASN